MLDAYQLSESMLKRALAVVLTMRKTSSRYNEKVIDYLISKRIDPDFVEEYSFCHGGSVIHITFVESSNCAVIQSENNDLHHYTCESPQEALVHYVFERESS